MAQRTGATWEGLSDPVRRIVTWAAAAEVGPEVGSPGLMLGILRAEPDSPPHTLLAHFGVSHGQLFDALQEVAPGMRLDPTAIPEELPEPPVLTSNAASILARAAEIHRDIRSEDVDAACVFGALLEAAASTAAVALSHALPQVPLPRLRDSYFDWLKANGLSYAQTLERDFPRPKRPAPNGRTPAGSRGPWSSVVRLMGPESGSTHGPSFVGHGFFVRPWLVATASAVADASDHIALVEGTAVSLVPESRDEQVALLRVAGAFELDDDVIAPLGTPAVGSPCEIAAFRDDSSARLVLGGRIGIDASGDLVVELGPRWGLEGEVVAGSPVIAEGEVVGVVATSRSDTSVTICDARQLARLLDGKPPPLPPATGTLSGAGNDAVGPVDQLGFGPYVTAFADLIAAPHTKPPLTIGIFGSWGSGKSFLLEHIEREIDDRQRKDPEALPRVHVVRFNAWEYSATEVVWPGLVRKIVTRLDKLTTWPRRRRIRERVRWNLKRQWNNLWPRMVGGAVVVAAAFATAIAQDEAGVATAIAGAVAVLGVGGLVKAARDPVAQWVTALFAESDYGRQLGVMEDIKHDLEQLERRLHREDPDGNDVVTGRILVLIDDLDRCEPAKAVEVLQAVNLLLN
ncbi:MAG TPA: P-loop NTPase fold protein, partial [Solirubrobacteraceae bacterium]|nr:P-loop NTPase fold protein [Solirubrobacteraceae bacterium]